MHTPIHILLAAPEHAAIVSAILRQSFAEFKPLYTPEGFAATTPDEQQVLARMQEGPIWLAYRGTEALATAGGVLMNHSLYLRGMAVLPGARRLGAGGQLLTHIETWAAERGCVRLFLSTTPFLHVAIRMYERFGYRRSADGAHDLFGTPLFQMEKSMVRA